MNDVLAMVFVDNGFVSKFKYEVATFCQDTEHRTLKPYTVIFTLSKKLKV